MQEEISALHTTNTWTLVPPSPTHNAIGCKWVFRVKYKVDGTLAKFKATLVAKAHNSALTCPMHSFMAPFMRTSICNNLQVLFTPHMCADPSLFVKADHCLTFILVYVDDIIITSTSFISYQALISQLSAKFSMKNLDNKSGEILSDPIAYRSLFGALQYLTWTRTKIAFSVNQVCQHMHTPRTPHLLAVKRILRYLKGTPAHGLLIHKGNLNITAYSDSDWAGCPIDRRSTTGYCIFFG
ncbi:unnamed protein product [Prunus armeniaca]